MPKTDDYEQTRSQIALRLKALRLERGFTHEELASKIDKQRTSIVQYEREREGVSPPLKVIEDLAKALDVSPAFLAYGVGGESNDPIRHSLEIRVLRRSDDGEIGAKSTLSVPKWWASERLGKDDNRMPRFAAYIDQNAPEFRYSAGDLLILAEDPIQPDNDLYVLDSAGGLMVVRYAADLARGGDEGLIYDGFGVRHQLPTPPKLIGRVLGSLTSKRTSVIF